MDKYDADAIADRIIVCIFLIIGIVLVFAFVIDVGKVFGQDVPEASKQYLPVLNKVIDTTWDNLSDRSVMAGQVEQETCYSLTHKKCWNPRTELKTSREYGFGLGQITIAYNKDGSERFNNFTDVKGMDPELRDWKWEDRYDPYLQLKALVVKDLLTYSKIKFIAEDNEDKIAMMLASYNGGLGGLLKDRAICKTVAGCDQNKWFDHVEKQSYKSKVAVDGYSKSFYQINREYVKNILKERKFKYEPYLKKGGKVNDSKEVESPKVPDKPVEVVTPKTEDTTRHSRCYRYLLGPLGGDGK